MRGRIIQYNGADGSGTFVADGRQHRFALSAWRGDAVPAVGRVVEAEVSGDEVTAVTAVRDDVLLKEQVSRIGGRLNTLVSGQLGSLAGKVSAMGAPAAAPGPSGPEGTDGTAPAAGISGTGRQAGVAGIVACYGRVLLGAYALFVLGTLVLDAVRIQLGPMRLGKSLFDIGALMSQMQIQGGGGIKLLLLLAYASFFAPLLRPGRRAWLALVVPLVALVWAMVSTLHTVGHAVGPMMGGELGNELSQVFSVGAGLYLAVVSALVLAAGGAWRALRAGQGWST